VSGAPESKWAPAFDGQRRPFEPGHELSTKHGAYSPRKVDPLAQTFVDLVLEDPAVVQLRAGHWRPALWTWARAEAQVQLLTEWLERESGEDGVGDLTSEAISRVYLLLHRAETRATTQRSRLGLDPLSAARLGRDRASEAVDTARYMQELARAEAEAEAQRREGGAADGQ
jgi:hypothetical protein